MSLRRPKDTYAVRLLKQLKNTPNRMPRLWTLAVKWKLLMVDEWKRLHLKRLQGDSFELFGVSKVVRRSYFECFFKFFVDFLCLCPNLRWFYLQGRLFSNWNLILLKKTTLFSSSKKFSILLVPKRKEVLVVSWMTFDDVSLCYNPWFKFQTIWFWFSTKATKCLQSWSDPFYSFKRLRNCKKISLPNHMPLALVKLLQTFKYCNTCLWGVLQYNNDENWWFTNERILFFRFWCFFCFLYLLKSILVMVVRKQQLQWKT